MDPKAQDQGRLFRVVVNHEEQYSIWPADREIPAGWRDAGKSGPEEACLDYIEEVWTDMRPASLRKALAATDNRRGTETATRKDK